jgi:periplasmic protein TonB
METNKILTANILDIIFDGRNKQYGAYDLRITYNGRIKKALLITGIFLLVVCITVVVAGMKNKNSLDKIDVAEVIIASVKEKEILPPIPPPVKVIPPAELNQVKFTKPVIVKEDEVKEDEKIEEIKEDQTISTKTIESDNKNAIVQAPVDVVSSQVIEIPKGNDEDKIFRSVEREAEFPGGNAAWARFVEKNMEGYNPFDNGAAPGKYQVIVRFVVSKDGSISNVQAETNFGYGMEEQAIKCIKKGPNWKPALQNGTNVNAYRRQPVLFIVEEQ